MPRALPAALALALILTSSGTGPAQVPDLSKPRRITFSAYIEPADPFSDGNQAEARGPVPVRRGEAFTVVLVGTLEPGFYTYPLTRVGQSQEKGQLARLVVKASAGLEPLYPIVENEPEWSIKPYLEPELVHKGRVAWRQEVLVGEGLKVGQRLQVTYDLTVQVCKESCFTESHRAEVEAVVEDAPPATASPELAKRPRTAPEPQVVPSPKGEGSSGESDSSDPGRPKTFLGAVLFALLGGFVSLLTPCVFPMIPITVSYFLKQSEARQGSAVLLAAVYSGTIVLVMAAGGLALMQMLSAVINHWVTNLLLGVVFAFFGLSLLGMYDITLPSWLQDMTSSGEGQGGYAGVFFMALTFSIISFACVGPIYGGFLSAEAAASATEGVIRRVASVLAFSVAFAAPFFLLALFPGWLRTLPRAGSWMNSVKVVMGFLELAAMVKFLRGAELLLFGQASILTYPISMGLYVAICAACSLYLFGLFRLPHDHHVPETISVTRLLFAMSFLTLALYLLPGVFPMKDEDIPARGTVYAWVDGFLLPDPKKGDWLSDLNGAVEKARAEKKLVFLDFTGINCSNCKVNERRMFPRPEVKAALSRHVLLKLYTDTVPAGTVQKPDAAGALALRTSRFETEALPLYALLRPTAEGFEVVAKYGMTKGLIEESDLPGFLKFLER
jgi:thiol:disulfide interchange protein